MAELFAEHWALSIAITIILGAIGSGLWDAALKPLGSKLGGFVFKVLTLNAKRSRDKVYLNAAMGHHELPSLYVFLIVVMVATAPLVASQIKLYSLMFEVNDAIDVQIGCADREIENLQECRKEALRDRISSGLYIASLFSIFFVVLIFYRFMSINRTNLVITYYNQSIKSIRPFVAEEEFQFLERDFSLMKGKVDFDHIMERLDRVAKDNNVSLPDSYINMKKSKGK